MGNNEQKTILFLCTGNYYRSRFAEYYFNAFNKNPLWKARSRGLDLEHYGNVGPVSSYAVAALRKLGIEVKNPNYPVEAEGTDLQNADKIIALSKKEHEPMINRRFSKWSKLVTYWEIGDIDVMQTDEAIPKIITELDNLINTLKV